MPDSSPTIRNIAAACGYSKSTVSAVLRGNTGFSSVTIGEVRRAAERLGYKPDARIRELTEYLGSRKRKPEACPLVWLNCEKDPDAWQSYPWLEVVYQHACRRAEQLGHRVDPFWTCAPGMTPRRMYEILHSRSIRGVILAARPGHAFSAESIPDHCAVVQIQGDQNKSSFHCIGPDYFENAMLAFHHLEQRGFRRIGMCLHQGIISESMGRYTGAFFEFRYQYGCCLQADPCVYDYADPGHRDVVKRWCESQRPDVLICNDNAMPAMLPESMNIPLVHLNVARDVENWPGIRQNQEQIGAACIEELVGQLWRNETHPQVNPRMILIRGRWQSSADLDAVSGS